MLLFVDEFSCCPTVQIRQTAGGSAVPAACCHGSDNTARVECADMVVRPSVFQYCRHDRCQRQGGQSGFDQGHPLGAGVADGLLSNHFF